MNRRPLFDQVTVIGLGLIGGSLGLALRRRKVARRVVGVARRAATIAQARRMGVIDAGGVVVAPAVAQAELVVIATPPSTVVPLAQAVARATRRGVLLTDAASTKAEIVRQWARLLPPRVQAVGSHPMAGSEQCGVAAASARLFEGALSIVTPLPETPAPVVRRVRALWQALGMGTVTMSPERHDAAVAMISHAPHLVAASLVLAATPAELAVAAMGFSEMTRVALGDPRLWQDICATNRVAVLAALARVEQTLTHLRRVMAQGDWAALARALAVSQRKRRGLAR